MRRASLATARAFRAILEDGRERVRQIDQDPIGDVLGEGISKKKLDRLMADGDPAAAGVVLGAVEAFAQEFATVIQRIMRLKEWCGTQRIVVGGGLRASRVAERAIGRTAALLKAAQHDVELQPIRHDPDEAGLIGCTHLAPSWIFLGHDGILAVNIGGSTIRVGVVELNRKKAADLSKSKVGMSELWRHADDGPNRRGAVPTLDGHEVTVLMHSDAVVQGLSEAPFMRDARHWGVMTIGTGLGNARFTN